MTGADEPEPAIFGGTEHNLMAPKEPECCGDMTGVERRDVGPDEHHRTRRAGFERAVHADPEIDVLISTGGTGVTGRDVTPEAFHSVYEKEIAGFGELFRWLSYDKVGTSTIQSRATAGVAGGTYLFALPGSPSACRDAWEGILVHQLDNRFRPCNFVELMPRLQEHLKR